MLDFGWQAGELSEGEPSPLTMTGAAMGTPAAMSPEQARGERVDHRSDIFSFGVVLDEMATGRIPFTGRSKADVISALLKQPHTSAAELNKEITAHLSAVIDRSLAKETAERYQTRICVWTGRSRQRGRRVGSNFSYPTAAVCAWFLKRQGFLGFRSRKFKGGREVW